MASTIDVESTLTDRNLTTLPETMRRALKLGKRDKVHYSIRPDGEVVDTRTAAVEVDDPMLGKFLGFLVGDIAKHPNRLQMIDTNLVQHVQRLVGRFDGDLHVPLPANNA